MFKIELEFRGIPQHHLEMYLEELGAERVTNSFPIIFEGTDWSAHILKEKEISFTAVFKVNSVSIHFRANEEDALNEVIKKFRSKTFRAGG